MLSVFEDANIITAITSCTNIQISSDDGYPGNICHLCIQRLNDAYSFKQQCETSDLILKDKIFISKIDEQFEVIYETEDNLECYTQLEYINADDKSNTAIKNESDVKVEYETDYEDDCVQDDFVRNCALCEQTFSSINSYENHSCFSEYSKCKTEDETTLAGQENSADQDIKSCDSLKRVKCDICFKTFATNGNLNKHMKIHCNIRPYKCPKCNKSFIQSNTLKYHMDIHLPPNSTPHACDQCDFSTRRLAALEKHIALTHKEVIPQRYLKECIPVSCTICNKVLGSEKSLVHHMKIHQNIREYICKYCGKDFVYKCGLESHERIHRSEKPFTCKYCNKSFKQKMGLHVHKRLHTGEKPYQCQICSKTFNQVAHLHSHLLTHTGEKKFECNVCHKRFALSEGLRYHKMIHTGELPHCCSICNRGFKIAYKLKLHMRRCHQTQNIS
ncbi:zinc finger protein OZF-like isoform X2 [Ctenocephalides felis]|nr:zinc finger protein OZF-like isoform X2 [Ctenocephalides felis]